MMALTSGANAQAQEVEEAEELEEIVITGIRKSLLDSLEVKRTSVNIVDAISAEDIGKFPDINVAESLQRIPGVTIERTQGEGQSVSIRGLGRDFVVSTLNGRSLVSGRGGSVGVRGFGGSITQRNFNFDVIPSELISAAEVYKTPIASNIEGGIGGVVDLKTAKPLAIGDKIVTSARGLYDTLSEEPGYKVDAFVSKELVEDKLGILIGFVRDERDILEKRYLNFNFQEVTLDADANPATPDILVRRPRRTVNAVVEEERTRTAIQGALQYVASSNLEINVDGFYSRFSAIG